MFATISAFVFFVAVSLAITVISGMFSSYWDKMMAALTLQPIPQDVRPRKAQGPVRISWASHRHVPARARNTVSLTA